MLTITIDVDDCREVLAEVERLAEDIASPSERCRILLNIADLWGQIGNTIKQVDMLDRASRLVSSITSPHQETLWLPLVASLTRSGNLEKSVQTMRQMTSDRYIALDHIARLQTENGDIADALRTTKDEPRPNLRAMLLKTIGMTQAKAGDLIGGLQTLEQALLLLTDNSYAGDDSYLLSIMVDVQIEMGELTAAVQTAAAIQMFEYHDSSLFRIALAQAERRDMIGALQTVDLITVQITKAHALKKISIIEAKQGISCQKTLIHALEAVHAAPEIKADDIAQKAHCLKSIARAQAQTGDGNASRATLIQARRIASRIPEDEMKKFALTLIAQAFAEIGQEAAYQNTLALAYQAINAITDEPHKETYHRGIAVAQARAGRTRDSQDTLALLRNADGSPQWESIAFAQEQIGDPIAIIEAAQRIHNPSRQCHYLLCAAKLQAKADDVTGCRETLKLARQDAEDISEIEHKVGTLVQIAKAQAGLE